MAIVTSVLTGGSNNHETTSEEANGFATDFVNEGIVGDITNTLGVAPSTGGFAVNAQGTPDMTVAVSAGVAYVTTTPSSQNSQNLRVKNSASTNVTISSNSSGSTKYDWLYITMSAANAANPNVAGDNVATLTTSRSTSASADDGTPPTYGYPIAVITVANGASSITNSNIRDIRSEIILNTGSTSDSSGWTTGLTVPTTIAYNGNRSYTLTIPSDDVTDTLSSGMRLKLTRTVTAPTQCADLEASSSQYFSKSSPSGMTFTDDFVVSAWVKLESYTLGVVASRYNGTSGWVLRVEANGTLSLTGYKGSASNYSQVTSYQSIPLGKWVHIASQLDMSTFTATTTTSYMMIDGVDVPAAVGRGGTNPTDLTQAGNLEIGANNGGLLPFDGKIAQVAIYSAKVTQATIKASISQTLSGSETSLISAYSFNNSINDLNANANNLTANGGALATNADTPFTQTQTGVTAGTTNYGIITAASFSTNTTLTVQVPEGDTIPTSGGVSAVSYSTQKVPYGFPADSGKWAVETLIKVQQIQSSPGTGTVYNVSSTSGTAMGKAITVPVGAWSLSYYAILSSINATNVAAPQVTLSTSNSAESDKDYTLRIAAPVTGAGSLDAAVSRKKSQNLSSATDYFLLVLSVTASATQVSLNGNTGTTMVTAELAYL